MAGEDLNVVTETSNQLFYPDEVVTALLDGRDEFDPDQPLEQLEVQVDSGSLGDVVQQDREPDGIGDLPVVLDDFPGLGQAVVRRQHHDALHPGVLRGQAQVNHVTGDQVAGAGN